VSIEKRRYGPGELNAFVAGGPPSTDDEVSITTDGFRLDSAEAVIAFVAELNGEDFVEEIVRDRTAANPEFPALLEDARRRVGNTDRAVTLEPMAPLQDASRTRERRDGVVLGGTGRYATTRRMRRPESIFGA
jgi:hypothetical protein